MADVVFKDQSGTRRPDTKFKDMGDGTFAEVVSVSGGGGGASGDVTAPGTSGTAAQAVQGITGGVPVGVVPSNITTKFRDAFENFTPGEKWTQVLGSGDIVMVDGNAAAASYLVISKSPLVAGSETSIESLLNFSLPVELAFGAHMSQRTLGQEFSVEIVDTSAPLADIPDIAITALQQTTTTLTVTTATNHGLSVGKSIGLRGVLDSRMNYPALVVVGVPAPNQFTCTAGPGGTIASLSSYVSTVLASTTAALPANAYANGASGVGATLTASANGAFPDQDGVTIPLGGRLLVRFEAAPANNGVYVLTQVGSAGSPWVLTRAADYDTAAELTVVAGALFAISVFVAGGATNSQKEFYLSSTVTTVGTTAVTWVDSNTTGPLGFVYFRERLGRANNGIAQIFEQPTATQASLYIRSESGDALPSGAISGNHSATVGTTASVQLVNAAYQYALAPTTEYRVFAQADRTQWADSAVDAVAQTTSRLLRTQVCPDPSETYKLRIRATNNKSLTVPGAQVVSVSKSGTTTGTFTTATPHGLLPGDLFLYYGSSDNAAATFPSLVAATAVASVPSDTTFTAVIGTGTSGTAYGGVIARVQGGNLLSALGAVAQTAINATLTTLLDGTRQLVLTGNGTWAGVAIGDLANVIGCRGVASLGASLGVDGPWKVANLSTTVLTLVSLPGQTWPADFATTTCGGAVIRRTDLRLSFVRVFDFERQRVEMLARPSGDIAGAAPVAIQGGTLPSVTTVTTVSTVSAVTAVTTVSAVTAANLGIPGIIADVASAAITSSASVAAITPTFGCSYQVNIPVTAVTGTNPTMDVSIEESDDSGTNWFRVYDFPRITAVGFYRSPLLPLTGNRVRYVQTIGGTSPSFTRAINRLQSSQPAQPLLAQPLYDDSSTITSSVTSQAMPAMSSPGWQAVLAVTAASGTTPSLAVTIEEQVDGTNWARLYEFPAITAVGALRSPILPNTGNRIRYVQTITGTTPSFTRLLSRVPTSAPTPGVVVDMVSTSFSSNYSSPANAQTFGQSYSVVIPVTAVSGTNPTMDVSVEESDDNGASWFRVYDFPRITGTGVYRSPLLRLTGQRIRYSFAFGGSAPSFTRSISRIQSAVPADPLRQLIDRSVTLTTLNSVTPSLDCRDAGNRLQLVVSVGAITTTPPQLQLEGSDDNGASWYSIGTPLAAVASSTVQTTVVDVNSALVRARVSTAGVGVTAGYVMIKAHD